MALPSESPELFVHVPPGRKGAWLLARVQGDEIQVLHSGAFEPAALDEAVEWLRYMLDGVMMSSVCEWWDVGDDLPDEVTRAFGASGPALRALIEGRWRDFDGAAASRGGPPC